MSFSISISGHVNDPNTDEGEEQSLVDDVKALIANHTDKVTYASGSFQYQGQVDLLPAPAVDPGTGDTGGDTGGTGDGTGDGGGTTPDTPPAGFVVKIVGENYATYAGRAAEAGLTTILDEAVWNLLAPSEFVQKLEGETYAEAQARLFIFNEAQPSTDTQAPVPSEAEWDALPVG